MTLLYNRVGMEKDLFLYGLQAMEGQHMTVVVVMAMSYHPILWPLEP